MRLGTMTAARASWRAPAATLGVAGLALAGIATALPAAADIEDDVLTVDIVGVNDFHGRIDEGRSVEDGVVMNEGAAVRLAAAVEGARDANADTLFVGAGDLFGASTFTSMVANDVPTTDAFNAMGLDVSSVGNHEFDQGIDTLQARIDGTFTPPEDSDAADAIEWPYLGANVYEAGTDDAVLPEYAVFETASGADIAFVGVVTTETPSLVTPAGVAGLDFGEPTEAVERVMDENAEVSEADAVVVLIHDGGASGEAVQNTETNFGEFVADMSDRGDIAAIFSGHTHTAYQVDVDGMPVIQTGSFGENLGKVTLTFDSSGTEEAPAFALTGAASDLIPLADYEVPAAGENGVVDEVRTIVEEAVEGADELGSQVIGHVSDDFNRARQARDTGAEENRGGESTIGNLIADAQLWGLTDSPDAPDAEPPVAAFMNPGGIRTDISYGEDGTVTYKEAATVQPFANTLNTFDLTGAQIKQVLEEQWQPDGASRPFLKLGLAGIWYFYDPDAPRDEHITYVEIDGAPLDEDATYRVVANNFLASGGDNFFTLGEGEGYADTGLVDLQSFVDYFKAAGAAEEVVSPDYKQRAIGVQWNTSQEDVYAVGDEISLDLSSMLFSTNEPTPEELALSLVDPATDEAVDLGSTPLDASVVPNTDEVGRADVRVTVPEIEGLGEDPQMWRLVITDEESEYSVWFDVALVGEAAPAPTPTDTPSPTETTEPSPTATTPPPGGQLPDTGADVDAFAIAAGLLLLSGAAVLVARRRRSLMR